MKMINIIDNFIDSEFSHSKMGVLNVSGNIPGSGIINHIRQKCANNSFICRIALCNEDMSFEDFSEQLLQWREPISEIILVLDNYDNKPSWMEEFIETIRRGHDRNYKDVFVPSFVFKIITLQ